MTRARAVKILDELEKLTFAFPYFHGMLGELRFFLIDCNGLPPDDPTSTSTAND